LVLVLFPQVRVDGRGRSRCRCGSTGARGRIERRPVALEPADVEFKITAQMHSWLGGVTARKGREQALNQHGGPLGVKPLPRMAGVDRRAEVVAQRHGRVLLIAAYSTR